MGRNFYLAMSLLWGIGTAVSAGLYYNKPNTPELQMMKATATYVQEYNGGNTAEKNPTEVLRKARESIKLVAKGKVEVKKISNLEYQVNTLSRNITPSTPPQMYEPAMKDLGEKMEKTAKPYVRTNLGLFNIGLFSVNTLINLVMYARED